MSTVVSTGALVLVRGNSHERNIHRVKVTMRYRPSIVLFSLVALALSAWGVGNMLSPGRASGQVVEAIPGDWPMYGHDLQRTNYDPDETLIGVSNVAQLVQRWQSADLGSNGFATSSGPSVANGKVYVGSSNPSGNNYYAFDALAGTPVWSANLGYQDKCTNVGIGSTAAISGTTLVVGGGDDAYYALDANTGASLWRNPMGSGPDDFPWASPLLANGRAYVGMASRCGEPSSRGEVRALDLATGAIVARQYLVPADKQGADVWQSPALSPDGSTLAVASGNDFGGYNGPYTRAMISLDPLTLEIRQAGQEALPDSDLDFGTTPIIFHDSTGRALVGSANKNGTFYTYALDNIAGGPIWSRMMGIRIGMMPAYDPNFGPGGTLFIVGASARLYAVNPATGNNRWPDVEANGRGNMAVANGLNFLNDNGVLRILDEKNGNLLRVIIPDHQGDSNSGVAVAHGFIYWLSGGYLNAWSLPEGSPPPAAPSPTAASAAPGTPQPATPPPSQPLAIPGSGSRLFPETGKTVSGIFLDYWNGHGALAQLGYPISDLLRERSALDGETYIVQYFERAIFEYHPENRPPYDVLLSQLGTFRYKQAYPEGAPNQQPNTTEGSVLFPETGKRLGGIFLDYWNTNGGLLQFGYPISDEFVEQSSLDGKHYIVQYFERAVLELHPENHEPYDVLLSQLGTLRYKAHYATRTP
jgi:outer membrane protein assembly factor BamB